MLLMNIMSLKAGFFCLALLFIFSTVVSAEDDGHCIWYGECNENEYNHLQNCFYTGPAKTLEPDGLEILSQRCPHFINNNGNDTKTCCNASQLKTLNKQLGQLDAVLTRCSNCLDNIVKHYCETTCSPIQSTFMNVTETKQNDNLTYITGVEVYLSEQYLEGTFNSCRGVIVPSMGRFALDLMCSGLEASECSAQKWFDFLGNAEDPYLVPFQITYIEGDDKVGRFTPANPKITPCNKGLNSQTIACSCSDCKESCLPPPLAPPPPQPFTLLDHDGIAVVMTIIFIGGSILFSLPIIYYKNRKQIGAISENELPHAINDKSTAIERLGAKY